MNRRQFVTGVAATAVGAALPVAADTRAFSQGGFIKCRPYYDTVWIPQHPWRLDPFQKIVSVVWEKKYG